jgi:hypothetical protein
MLAPIIVLALAAPASAEAPCIRDLKARDVRPEPGPRLRFGIGPLAQAGQIGPNPAPAVAERPARTHADRLAAP